MSGWNERESLRNSSGVIEIVSQSYRKCFGISGMSREVPEGFRRITEYLEYSGSGLWAGFSGD